MVSLTHTHCPPSISYTPILLIYTIPFFACWSSVSPSGRRRSRPTRRVPPAKKTKKAHVFQSLPKCRTPTFAICPQFNSRRGEYPLLENQRKHHCFSLSLNVAPPLLPYVHNSIHSRLRKFEFPTLPLSRRGPTARRFFFFLSR